MKISLVPQYRADELILIRNGDELKINGETYDFTPLQNGATLPFDAHDCQWICGNVERDNDGVLNLEILLPIQKSIFHDVLEDIVDPPDGLVDLPVIKEDYE